MFFLVTSIALSSLSTAKTFVLSERAGNLRIQFHYGVQMRVEGTDILKLATWHNGGGSNYLYADGHAGSIPFDEKPGTHDARWYFNSND